MANFSEASASVLTFNYPISLDGIPVLGAEKLEEWRKDWSDRQEQGKHALDFLYVLEPPHSEDFLLG